MKIRILSDLHLHQNRDFPFKWKKDDILTIIAGDISYSIKQTLNFLKQNFSKVVFVEGNHIGYRKSNELIQTKIANRQKIFTKNSHYVFLENDYVIINGIVFIGAILWTNQKYINEKYKHIHNRELTKEYCKESRTTNVRYKFKSGIISTLNYDVYKEMHQESITFIENTLNKFKDKKCVLVTHYPISAKVIGEEFKYWKFNCTVVSELDEYFSKFKNLKCIIHGHTHKTASYKVGKIPVYCNSLGKITNGELENKKFIQNLIIEI